MSAKTLIQFDIMDAMNMNNFSFIHVLNRFS